MKKLMLALFVVMIVFGMVVKSDAQTTPSMITYAVHADPMVFWDPAETWAAEIKVLQNIYEPLVKVIPGKPDKFIPILAESWTESADHLKWTFKIRKNVKL